MRRFSVGLRCVVGLALACAACGRLTTARANDIWVDNVGGDDLLDGTTPDKPGGHVGPVRTIAKAVRIAGPGDRVQLKKNAEPYHENFTLFGWQHSGMNPEAPNSIQRRVSVLSSTYPLWDREIGSTKALIISAASSASHCFVAPHGERKVKNGAIRSIPSAPNRIPSPCPPPPHPRASLPPHFWQPRPGRRYRPVRLRTESRAQSSVLP